MKFIEWCGLFVIGDKTIDEQHKKLFDMANTFVDLVAAGAADRKAAFILLNQLTRYAQDHFQAEEEAARRHGYPADDLQGLAQSHEKLVEDIFNITEHLSKQKVLDVGSIEKFLNDWLVLHVLIEDKKIARCIK